MLVKLNSVLTLITLAMIASGSIDAASIDSTLIVRPKGSSAFSGEAADLLAKGEQLWNDKSLSRKGNTACSSCHKTATRMFKKSFMDDYPHAVKMVGKKARLDTVTTEGMVQFCMVVPMKSQPLAWDSEDLAALTAYSEKVVQQNYIKARSGK